MARGRNYSFGAVDQSVVDNFSMQLDQYKYRLTELYSQKAKILADRDARRFKYLAGYRSQLEGIAANIVNEIYAAADNSSLAIFNKFMRDLKSSLPMETLQGGRITDPSLGHIYGTPIHSRWWVTGQDLVITLASPTESWFIKPYANGRTLYEAYPNMDWDTYKSVIDKDIAGFGVFASAAGPRPVPATIDWLKKYIQTMTIVGQGTPFYSLSSDQLLEYATRIYNYLNKDYGQGSLETTLQQGKELLYQIMFDMVKALSFQRQIDAVEADVKAYVLSFKDSGVYDASLVSNDAMAELLAISKQLSQAEAARALAAAKAAADAQPPIDSTIVTVAPTVQAPAADVNQMVATAPAPQETPAKKSNNGLLLGLAALGTLLFMNSDKD